MSTPPRASDPGAAIATLRARGAAQADPVRFALAEALARRGARLDGAARAEVERRLGDVLAQLESAVGQAAPSVPTTSAPTAAAPGPLADLLDRLGRSPAGAPPAPGSGYVHEELKSVRAFRGAWTRLAAERELGRSRTLVPANAGPLNTQRLVHETMAALREASPEALALFVGHLETLLWLDGACGGDLARHRPATGAVTRPR